MLKELTSMINEGRLSRKDLTIAEIILTEARRLYEKGDYAAAEIKIGAMTSYIKSAENAILPILSRYHKALLINYPNEEDRKIFNDAKRKGLIPSRAGIGGLIEIHGGGKDGMTYGCVAMENKHIEELYNIIKAGTPVTIVGTMDYENRISSKLKGL
ncbi:MAG: hypothetical protein COZ31_09250 [Nitrospirae bacterium CG_4_10_14_3_um_filter_44_29]|nr:MAG: hypothetical protein COW90_05800 [Nitrospirae bacterium CG22_combo_CG10-13_8_21_14_all_44_11]PIX87667.1 MAG: hypothetical protein COZ31_09250 [Nitrospirae bacterium CG_4_10_14_3_um_filter_44_29]PJA82124.1 MAG: hypothetical protein CO147_06370 [Nitrospirae bacterium CG_4_9_14_3_um_filter_44_28]